MNTLWPATLLLLLTAPSHAAFRSSTNYRTAPDALTQGGGRSTSGSYIATQQALGQISGITSSPGYRNQVGITQVDPVTQVPVTLSQFTLE